MHISHLPLLALLIFAALRSPAADLVLEKRMHHLRAGNEREWDRFKSEPQVGFKLAFNAAENPGEMSLAIRQEDVKLAWIVRLNGQDLGLLDQDENAGIRYLAIPANCLKATDNVLTISYHNPANKADRLPDDILVGAIQLLDRPMKQLLSEAQVEIDIVEKETNRPVASRITVTTVEKALQPLEVRQTSSVAVRTGCVYTADGRASFSLPEGRYKIYASRGFEYGADSVLLDIRKGKPSRHRFVISREVPTRGWVASDTHIHTFTNSRHGDATIAERLVTIAGEGIELPVFTDHNFVSDVRPKVKEMGLDTVFTPVNGNEFTTEVGHFNVFPVADHAKAPDHHVKDWASVARNLESGKQVTILNHARDLHNGFVPFGPQRHISVTGQDLDGWKVPANAMEVVNSSSQQKDIMQLYRDWFGLLNRGLIVTPVGSSDSHDVMRYLVGQARTYIKCADGDPASIDVNEAVDQLLAGRVMASFGLLAEITADDKYGPGDLAPASANVQVAVRVLGPSWVRADRVSLYANGQKIREARITREGKNGVKWQGTWTIPARNQDMHLAAIAEGPDPGKPFWIIPKPYSRISSEWRPRLIGSSGAVWIDADGDRSKTSAYDYARRLLENTSGDTEKLFRLLNTFDESVSMQAASILQEQHKLSDALLAQAMKNGPAVVKSGFGQFEKAYEEAEKARERERGRMNR